MRPRANSVAINNDRHFRGKIHRGPSFGRPRDSIDHGQNITFQINAAGHLMQGYPHNMARLFLWNIIAREFFECIFNALPAI